MTHVVTDSCINCKYTDCVPVCPVDCFREGENFLVIDPEECIDCGLCIAECPVEAIKSEACLEENEQIFLLINKELSEKFKFINLKKQKMEHADYFAKIKDKIKLIKRN